MISKRKLGKLGKLGLDYCPDCGSQTPDLYAQPEGDSCCTYCAKDRRDNRTECADCGDMVLNVIGCPNGNEVCQACFDAGSDGPE